MFVLRDKADKVIYWLKRFAKVGDVAANPDSVHAGLPWAGIRLLLEVAVAGSDQMDTLLTGCETAPYMLSRLDVYIDFYNGLRPMAARNNLEESIVNMYTLIFHFLPQSIRMYETAALKRAFSAIWKIEDVVTFEKEIRSWPRLIESVQMVEVDPGSPLTIEVELLPMAI